MHKDKIIDKVWILKQNPKTVQTRKIILDSDSCLANIENPKTSNPIGRLLWTMIQPLIDLFALLVRKIR